MTQGKTKDELLQLVIKTISEVAKIEITENQYEENLLTLGVDSIKAIQIVNELEDELDIMIDDSNLKYFNSIQAIADFIENMQG
jgi:acyl carrier protein